MKRGIFVISIILLIILIMALNGCQEKETAWEGRPTQEQLIGECIRACESVLMLEQDLSQGPCLLDPMPEPNWVCDIAHDPRDPVDNLKENQCNAWHQGTAKHFIEVTPTCEFIRAV